MFVLKSGLRILIWAPQVPFSVPLKNPKWVILGVFGYFPLKPKIFTANGRKCPTAKTKNSFEISEQNGTTCRYVEVKKRKNSELESP